MKKCVIIGSGIGGLSCGVILAKNGYQVTVLEQADQIGGCLQCFRRRGAAFETGMHYIGSALPGQKLHTIFRYLGISPLTSHLSPLDTKAYDIVSFQGKRYAFANGKEGFTESLSQHFPHSREELSHYYDLMKSVAASSPLHSLSHEVDISLFSQYQTRAVSDVIDTLISDPLLRQVIAAILPLYAGEKGRTPFTIHALISDFYDQSAFRIVGGSDIVAKALAKRITDMGGKVLTHQKAIKIQCDERQATAVVALTSHLSPLTSHLPPLTSHLSPLTTETFPANLVISSLHPAATMQLIDSVQGDLKSPIIRPAYRQRMLSLQNTTSVFTVYLKFKKDTVRYMNSNLYYYRSNTVWGCEDYDEGSWPKQLLYMHFCHIPSFPEYAQTGQILTFMRFDEVSKWQGTHPMQRGEDYEVFKRRKAETVIRALEEEVH